MDLSRDDFLLLHPALRHPQRARIERASACLARGHGLLTSATSRRFEAFNTLSPYVYPDAPAERVIVCALWCNWLFFFDDAHDEADGAGAGPDGLRAQIQRYLAVLRGEAPGDEPLSRLAATFRDRAQDLAAPGWMGRFCAAVEDYLLRGALPAYERFLAQETSPEEEYLRQRDHDSAVQTALDLVELALGLALPPGIREDAAFRDLQAACVRTIACFNDIVSYPKEVLVNGNPNNLVHVLEARRGLTRAGAMREAVRITNEAAERMVEAEAALSARSPAVRAYCRGLRQWQRGHIESSLREPRYRSPDSPFPELRGERISAG